MLSLAGSLMGAVLALVGRRGRVVARGMFCRRCGYDLRCIEAPGACPECGTNLARRRAVSDMLRRPRRVIRWIGRAVLVGSLAWGVVWTWQNRWQIDWQVYKPVWLLIRQSRSGDNFALMELNERMATLRLSNVELSSVLEGLIATDRNAETLNWLYADAVRAMKWTDVWTPKLEQRCINANALVTWSAFGDADQPCLLLSFQSRVGENPLPAIDPVIESASIDGGPLPLGEMETLWNGVRQCVVILPPSASGTIVTIHWRVRYLDEATLRQVGPEWTHTEQIDFVPGVAGSRLRADD
ncbi:MAG: hypothetical protein H7Y88_01985 [Phycisphaerales bacterium]|nr:hypothetical protein [Phycisphaerales bacterium]